MMRLNYFRYHAPYELDEAVRILAEEGPDVIPLAGGTDLLPNMKRKQQVPQTLLALRNIKGMKDIGNSVGLSLGAGLSLTNLIENKKLKGQYPDL